VLRLHAYEVVANAELAAGDAAAAAAAAERGLAAARDHRPYGREYRLHLLHARALAARGDAAGAAAASTAAAREVARLRDDLTGPMRRSFDRLPEVRATDERARGAGGAA
jgi:hypothetical protein